MAELPPPVFVAQDMLIENVFPLPQQPEVADITSHRIAEQYLIDRYNDPPPEGTDPSIIDVPTVVEQTRVGAHLVWPRSEEPLPYPVDNIPWFTRWSQPEGRKAFRWVRALLAANLLVNAALNIDQVPNVIRDGIEVVQGVKDKVEDTLHVGRHKVEHVEYSFRTEQQTVPGGPATTEMFAPSKVGEAAPVPSAVDQFFTELAQLKDKGVVIDKGLILGEASDDWRANPDCDLEVTSDENINLALERAKEFKRVITVEAEARGIQLPELEIINVNPKPSDLDEAEKRLNSEERQVAENLAQEFGYPDFCTATGIFTNDPDSLPPILRTFIETRIGNRRGMSLVFQGHVDDQHVNVLIPDIRRFTTNEPDGSPNKKHSYDLDWVLFPWPVIPGTHKRPGTKTVMEPLLIPGVEGEDEWLRIYEEGANEDMTLKKEAWAYTRKYQAMFREGRIKNVYNLEYLDADGAQQRMRVLYADHTPTFEAAASFGIQLQSIIQMRGGNIGHNLDAIVVYPQENAGVAGNTPKQVGLGVDYQHERNVLGLAYYSLGLVEMHMPTNPTEEYLQDFYGALWTFAHENGGHFIAHNQQPAQLTPIDNRLDRHFIASDQRADFGSEEYNRLMALEQGQTPPRRLRDVIMRRPVAPTDRRWWVRQALQTRSDTTRVVEHDTLTDHELRTHRWPLLVRIQNRFPTRYSRTNSSEFWADTAAQAITGIDIPFNQQRNLINPPSDADFALGYAIGTTSLRLVQRTVGSDPTSDGITWPNQAEAERNWRHYMTTVETDSHLEPLARQARIWDFRHQDDPRVWNILARARRSQR